MCVNKTNVKLKAKNVDLQKKTHFHSVYVLQVILGSNLSPRYFKHVAPEKGTFLWRRSWFLLYHYWTAWFVGFQVMDFTKENVASYIAMVGVLSVLAQVSLCISVRCRGFVFPFSWSHNTRVSGFVSVLCSVVHCGQRMQSFFQKRKSEKSVLFFLVSFPHLVSSLKYFPEFLCRNCFDMFFCLAYH